MCSCPQSAHHHFLSMSKPFECKLIINCGVHEMCGWSEMGLRLTCKLPNMTFQWTKTKPQSLADKLTHSPCTCANRRKQQCEQSTDSLPEFEDLFLQVVTGVETRCFWYCFGDAPRWWPVWGQVQGGAVWSGLDCSPSRPWTCYGLDLDVLNLICDL